MKFKLTPDQIFPIVVKVTVGYLATVATRWVQIYYYYGPVKRY